MSSPWKSQSSHKQTTCYTKLMDTAYMPKIPLRPLDDRRNRIKMRNMREESQKLSAKLNTPSFVGGLSAVDAISLRMDGTFEKGYRTCR